MFGWVLISEYDEQQKFVRLYPARTSWRGFEEKTQVEAYKKVSEYLAQEAPELLKEANS